MLLSRLLLFVVSGAACSFAHSRDELRHTTAFFKTNMCRNWLSGRCLHPETCNHAHGMQELLFFRTIATQSGVRDFVKEKTTTRSLSAAEEGQKDQQGTQQLLQQAGPPAPAGTFQGAPQLSPAAAAMPHMVPGSISHTSTVQQQQRKTYSLEPLSGQLLETLTLQLQHHCTVETLIGRATGLRPQQLGRGDASAPAATPPALGLDQRRPRRNRARVRGAEQQQQQQDASVPFEGATARVHRNGLQLQQARGPTEAVAAALLQVLQATDQRVTTNPSGSRMPWGPGPTQQQQQQEAQQAAHYLSNTHREAAEYKSSVSRSDNSQAVKGPIKGALQQRPEVGHWDVESTGSTETVSSTAQMFEEGSRVSSREWLGAENLAELFSCEERSEQRQHRQVQQQQQRHQQQPPVLGAGQRMEAATPFDLHQLLAGAERQQPHDLKNDSPHVQPL